MQRREDACWIVILEGLADTSAVVFVTMTIGITHSPVVMLTVQRCTPVAIPARNNAGKTAADAMCLSKYDYPTATMKQKCNAGGRYRSPIGRL